MTLETIGVSVSMEDAANIACRRNASQAWEFKAYGRAGNVTVRVDRDAFGRFLMELASANHPGVPDRVGKFQGVRFNDGGDAWCHESLNDPGASLSEAQKEALAQARIPPPLGSREDFKGEEKGEE